MAGESDDELVGDLDVYHTVELLYHKLQLRCMCFIALKTMLSSYLIYTRMFDMSMLTPTNTIQTSMCGGCLNFAIPEA
jgi:hypothetical protein